MAPRLTALTGHDVECLPSPCAECLSWELGAASPAPRTRAMPPGIRASEPQPSDALVRKEAWVSARVQEGSPPGRMVTVDGRVVAFGLFAPVRYFSPRRSDIPQPSTDALLLSTIWVDIAHRGAGIGSLLVRAAIREALRLHLVAVESYGDRRFREGSCILPAGFLLARGFIVRDEHPRTPILRVDVRRAARWAESLEQAWDEALERLPRPAPSPAPQQVRSATSIAPDDLALLGISSLDVGRS